MSIFANLIVGSTLYRKHNKTLRCNKLIYAQTACFPSFIISHKTWFCSRGLQQMKTIWMYGFQLNGKRKGSSFDDRMNTYRKKKGRKNGEDRKTITKWKHNFLLNKQTSFFAVIALSLLHGSSNNYSAHYAILSTEFHYLVGYISCLLRLEMIKRFKQWPNNVLTKI